MVPIRAGKSCWDEVGLTWKCDFPSAPALWVLCETSCTTPQAQTVFGEKAAWHGVQDAGLYNTKLLMLESLGYVASPSVGGGEGNACTWAMRVSVI